MGKVTSNVHGEHSYIKLLVMTALVLVILVDITEVAPFAYITDSGNNTVSVIDTATGRVTATVTVGYSPSPSGSF